MSREQFNKRYIKKDVFMSLEFNQLQVFCRFCIILQSGDVWIDVDVGGVLVLVWCKKIAGRLAGGLFLFRYIRVHAQGILNVWGRKTRNPPRATMKTAEVFARTQ